MKKAVIVSLDLFFASLVILYFLLSFSTYQTESNFNKIMLNNLGEDVLFLIEDELESRDIYTINQSLSKYIPLYNHYYVKIDYYDNHGAWNQTISFGDTIPDDFVVIHRPFLIQGWGTGVTELILW